MYTEELLDKDLLALENDRMIAFANLHRIEGALVVLKRLKDTYYGSKNANDAGSIPAVAPESG